MKPPKMSIIFRKDLKVRKGKLAAQVSHASMKIFFDRMKKTSNGYECDFTPEMEEWKDGSFTKIVLGCDTEDEIFKIKEEADKVGIPSAIIIDNGLTEFNGVKTVTCIAVGPGPAELVEKITSKYQLL